MYFGDTGQWIDYQPSGAYTSGYGGTDVAPSTGYYYSPGSGYYYRPRYWGGRYYARPGVDIGVGPYGYRGRRW